jgi:hypothetical protein
VFPAQPVDCSTPFVVQAEAQNQGFSLPPEVDGLFVGAIVVLEDQGSTAAAHMEMASSGRSFFPGGGEREILGGLSRFPGFRHASLERTPGISCSPTSSSRTPSNSALLSQIQDMLACMQHGLVWQLSVCGRGVPFAEIRDGGDPPFALRSASGIRPASQFNSSSLSISIQRT